MEHQPVAVAAAAAAGGGGMESADAARALAIAADDIIYAIIGYSMHVLPLHLLQLLILKVEPLSKMHPGLVLLLS